MPRVLTSRPDSAGPASDRPWPIGVELRRRSQRPLGCRLAQVVARRHDVPVGARVSDQDHVALPGGRQQPVEAGPVQADAPRNRSIREHPRPEQPADDPWRPPIHLPLADPYQAPEGYYIKGNTHSGLYYTPESALYDNTIPEVWFASEDLAQANGFVKAPE